MKIKLIVVGKIKEQFYKDAIKEYEKRILPMANINIVEVYSETLSFSGTGVTDEIAALRAEG